MAKTVATFSILDSEGWFVIGDTDGVVYRFKQTEIVRVQDNIDPSTGLAIGTRFTLGGGLEFIFNAFLGDDFCRLIHPGNPVPAPSDAAAIDLTAQVWGGPYPAAPAIADFGPFPTFSPTRVPRVTVGPAGVAVTITISGTTIGPNGGQATSSALVFGAGGGTLDAPQAFATVTSVTSDVAPGDVVDFEAYNTQFFPAATGIYAGVTGSVQMGLFADTPIRDFRNLEGGIVHDLGVNRVNIDGTTATDLLVLFTP